jgi:diaminopimelate epimerase
MKMILAQACQNTFVLVDLREQTSLDATKIEKIHNTLLKEDRDDAIILLNQQQHQGKTTLEMKVLGKDGAFGEFCGNGSRAVCAYFSYESCQSYPILLTSPFGNIPLTADENGIYSTHLPFPSFKINQKFVQDPSFLSLREDLHYVEMIEPHLVTNKKLSDEELTQLGKELNQKKDVFPHGINVNAYYSTSGDTIFVKTYERGVQRLTRSCGTGSVSAAISYQKKGLINVQTKGGKLLIVADTSKVILKGPAIIEGVLL